MRESAAPQPLNKQARQVFLTHGGVDTVRGPFGHGVAQDYAQARHWLQHAAQQGHPIAQHDLGVLYARGDGVPQDYSQARQWWQRAVDQGEPSAQVYLGAMYLRGDGVPEDHTHAFQWYRRAAEQGHAGAQLTLGVMYALGKGVSQENIHAYMWLQLAAVHSPPGPERERAVQSCDELAARMTPAQIAHAQELARTWKAKPESAPKP